jgi:hypothetical protein
MTLPFIDPRVRSVHMATLRSMNATFLRTMNDEAYIIRHKDEPLAVIVGYDEYQRWLTEVKRLQHLVDTLLEAEL